MSPPPEPATGPLLVSVAGAPSRPDAALVFVGPRFAASVPVSYRDVEFRAFESLDEAVKVAAGALPVRKELPPSELVALAANLEASEQKAARARQGRPGEERSGKLPEHETGETRDKVASVLGWSGRTYEKAKEVCAAAAAEPDRFGDLPGLMDETSVDAAYRQLRERRDGPTYPRPRQFDGKDASEAVTLVRGALIEGLDDAYMNGPLGEVLFRDSDEPELRAFGLRVFQAVQLALFPEEFADGPAAPGIVPPAGPRRVGPDRLTAFAELIKAGKRTAG